MTETYSHIISPCIDQAAQMTFSPVNVSFIIENDTTDE